MADTRMYLLTRLKTWGCGLEVLRSLTEAERRELHEFKSQVAELGEKLYAKMSPETADIFIVKTVLGVIATQFESLEE